ncbi:glycine betaine/proline transport system substrate-binding protein [Desulfobotulus alkaliphilus]|uniref:Glycine betaine/proline transport system substrate-binding protein n=2 Tax=Desulfobotulus alkaliphilus TaxID=622671 RepID=A0A562S154_9BACT|nr:glycine betaine/proline transport system substrate-binding protein [Desulfobotulus alkaliphilus]
MKRSVFLSLFTAFMTLMILGSGTALAQKKVRLAYVEWDCSAASTHLVQAVLQEKMGYEVEILPVAAAAMFQALATGNVDGMVTAWLPVTHEDYYERVKNRVEDLGPIVGGAKLGWAVPSYVNIDSIEEINDHAAKFKNRVVGIDPGAGLMRLSEQAMKDYGLNKMQLMEGSGATMTAALDTAIRRNEWVVVTAWSPHWMFGAWDLKYLDDPKGILGGEEFIHTLVRKDLKKDMPEVYNFLKNFAWKDAGQLQMVMAWDQERGADRYENAKRFIKENEEQVKGWLK